MLLLFSPWGVRNYVLYGDPVAPIFIDRINNGRTFFNLLGENSFDYIQNTSRTDESVFFFFSQENKNLYYYLTLPVKITFSFSHLKMPLIQPGAIFLVFFFLFIVRIIKSSRDKKMMVLYILTFIYIFFLFTYTKTLIWYVFPLFPILLVIYQTNYDSLGHKLKRLAAPLVFVYSVIIFTSYVFTGNASYLAGYKKEQDKNYLIDISDRINNLNLDNKLILGIYEPRTYYMKNPNKYYIPDLYETTFRHMFEKELTGERIRQKLKKMDIGYFLLNTKIEQDIKHALEKNYTKTNSPNISRSHLEAMVQLDEFQEKYLESIYENEEYILYRLK
jgi:hypothetical protein